MPTSANPYAHSRTEDEFREVGYPAQQHGSYAVPDPQAADAPYLKALGYASALRVSPTEIPDAARLQAIPLRDYRPNPVRPPDEFWQTIDADRERRYSVEQIDADGWEETKDGFGYPQPRSGANRWGRNPRENPPPEERPTQKLAPRSYNFVRPFMQGQAKMGDRDLNGIHFSMADHMLSKVGTEQLYGMYAPRRPGAGTRNTFRMAPPPWDTELVDRPPANDGMPQYAPIATVEVPQTRSWSLR